MTMEERARNAGRVIANIVLHLFHDSELNIEKSALGDYFATIILRHMRGEEREGK